MDNLFEQNHKLHWHAENKHRHETEDCGCGVHPSADSRGFIWGGYAKMLRHGGPFKPTDGYKTYYDKDGKPITAETRKKVFDYDAGETYENMPDPRVSNTDYTLTIVTKMIRARFTHEQIVEALSDPHNVGGLYYRSLKDGEAYLHAIYAREQWFRFDGYKVVMYPRNYVNPETGEVMGSTEPVELWELDAVSLSDDWAVNERAKHGVDNKCLRNGSPQPYLKHLIKMGVEVVVNYLDEEHGERHAITCTCVICVQERSTVERDGRKPFIISEKVCETIVSGLNRESAETVNKKDVWSFLHAIGHEVNKMAVLTYVDWLVTVGLLERREVSQRRGRPKMLHAVPVDVQDRWRAVFGTHINWCHYSERDYYVAPVVEEEADDDARLSHDEVVALLGTRA